jgi:hypothetical protein
MARQMFKIDAALAQVWSSVDTLTPCRLVHILNSDHYTGI